MTAARISSDDLDARRKVEEALLLRRRRASTTAPDIPRIPRTAGTSPGEQRFRAAVSQEGMWASLHGTGPAPLILSGVRLRGALDVAALRDALRAVAERHETLRSGMRVEDGVLTQVVAPSARVDLPVTDAAEGDLPGLVRDEVDRRFDLGAGPLFRARLIRFGADDHLLFMVLHHLIGDGRSLEIMLRDVTAYYLGAGAGLPGLAVQYADFAAWHRERLAGPRGTEMVDYWVRQLAGAEPAVLPADLPVDPDPSEPASVAGGALVVPMPDEVFGHFSELARSRRTTPYVVGLAAFKVLLARHSGQRDICVRAPISYRDRAEVLDLIADFSNDVVVRTDLTGEPALADVLDRVQAGTARDFTHHELPPHLLGPHFPPGFLDRLFHVQFTAERDHALPPRLGDLRTEPMPVPYPYTHRPLSVRLRFRDTGAYTVWLHRTARFSPGRVERLAGDYHELLLAMATRPASPAFD
jgi:hypothetical protein